MNNETLHTNNRVQHWVITILIILFIGTGLQVYGVWRSERYTRLYYEKQMKDIEPKLDTIIDLLQRQTK